MVFRFICNENKKVGRYMVPLTFRTDVLVVMRTGNIHRMHRSVVKETGALKERAVVLTVYICVKAMDFKFGMHVCRDSPDMTHYFF